MHVAQTAHDCLTARLSLRTPVLMPGSPIVEKSLNDELARAGGISTQEDAQEFADVVSGVNQACFNHTIYHI